MNFRRYIGTVSKHGNSLMVAIPTPLLHALALQRGDHVALIQTGKSLLVMPIEDAIRARYLEDGGAVRVAESDPVTT